MSLSDPRQGQEVRLSNRYRLSIRMDQGHTHAAAGTECQCLCGTLCAQCTGEMPGSPADPEPSPSTTCAENIRGILQRSSTPPGDSTTDSGRTRTVPLQRRGRASKCRGHLSAWANLCSLRYSYTLSFMLIWWGMDFWARRYTYRYGLLAPDSTSAGRPNNTTGLMTNELPSSQGGCRSAQALQPRVRSRHGTAYRIPLAGADSAYRRSLYRGFFLHLFEVIVYWVAAPQSARAGELFRYVGSIQMGGRGSGQPA